jgi:hypothetical protein
VDLKFGCEAVGRSADQNGLSPYWLRGLCAPYVEDRWGPPYEWNLFDTKFLFQLERTPLVAHVNVVSEEDWINRFVLEKRPWPKDWIQSSDGIELEPLFVESLQDAYNRAAEKAKAIVYYVEPDPEHLALFDSRDARLWISLRMTNEQIRNWNRLWERFLGKPVPPCALTVSELLFAGNDQASLLAGDPTWVRFVSTHTHVASERYDLRVASTWDEIEFSG